jgi:hypothetical protein
MTLMRVCMNIAFLCLLVCGGCNIKNGNDGKDGDSCSVKDNDDGTKAISCEDGTEVIVSNGEDSIPSKLIDNGRSTADRGTPIPPHWLSARLYT